MVKIANVAGMTQIAKVANVMASMKKEKAVKVVSVVQIRRAYAQGVLEPKPIILLYYPPYPREQPGPGMPTPNRGPTRPLSQLDGCQDVSRFSFVVLSPHSRAIFAILEASRSREK